MELHLGLALPTDHTPLKGFDLNNHGFDPKEAVGLEPWSHGCCLESKDDYVKNKRSFDAAFEKIGDTKQTLPLFVWNGQPDEEDDPTGQNKETSYNINKNDGEGNHVVGWPPIKSWRRKLLHQHQGGQTENIPMVAKNERGGSNAMYVKVKMEGVAIGRKIDLRLYHSYKMLTNTLISMFIKHQKGDKDGTHYTLAYQDKEGDWLLAGDVPWQSFIKSVQRLEVLKTGG
ncbi:hypothetical protein L1049_013056 [Liquidambar formosana]|uniref:Auxin-responsive protein n=1 Tax=Liquidambar formosana TaxID=63359 RepID=A0AAP0RLX8_LIQFO